MEIKIFKGVDVSKCNKAFTIKVKHIIRGYDIRIIKGLSLNVDQRLTVDNDLSNLKAVSDFLESCYGFNLKKVESISCKDINPRSVDSAEKVLKMLQQDKKIVHNNMGRRPNKDGEYLKVEYIWCNLQVNRTFAMLEDGEGVEYNIDYTHLLYIDYKTIEEYDDPECMF